MAQWPIGSLAALALLTVALGGAAVDRPLPGGYFAALEEGVARVQARLDEAPRATLRDIEQRVGWRHFPHAILAAAVLYSSSAPENRSHGDPRKLALAIRIGDLAADDDERGNYYSRLDSYWDTYMWLEAYRLLEAKLDAGRRERWKACLIRNVAMVSERCRAWRDFPAYNYHFLGTSTNHFALWATNLMIAGRLFERSEWRVLGEHILHRLAITEQSPDGYWGEYSAAGPTNGYNLLTLATVGVYWEYTRDAAALTALGRATDFHLYFTYPDGEPVEVINDRNRYWEFSLYGNFAFTHFADGRGFASFLFNRFPASRLDMEALGRIAQNALYYRSGTLETIPQRRARYAHRLSGPAGIRKSGPWVVSLSGIIATQPSSARWFLERQSNVSVFHERTGLIITGGNSRGQPNLATFSETSKEDTHYLPLWSRLKMGDTESREKNGDSPPTAVEQPRLGDTAWGQSPNFSQLPVDRLWLAHNSFSVETVAPAPRPSELALKFVIHGRGTPPESARLALQLCLKDGEELETGTGLRVRLGREKLILGPEQIGGLLRHHGWTLTMGAGASLEWPVFPYNPYRGGPEVRLDRAVAVLSVPLVLKADPANFVRPSEQTIQLRITVPE